MSQNQHGSYKVSLLFNFFLYFPFFFSFNQLFILNCLMQNESESRSVVSDSLKPHGLLIPWNSPGQNTGVGTLSLLQGIFPTQGLNLGLPHCRRILYQLSHKGSPRILECVAYPFSSGSSRPWFNSWVGKIPCRREWLPTPVFWPGEFHGLYSSWGCKQSDTTEQLSLSLHFEKMEKALEMDDCTTMREHLMPLNYTPKNH